jgi:hypothetical protein
MFWHHQFMNSTSSWTQVQMFWCYEICAFFSRKQLPGSILSRIYWIAKGVLSQVEQCFNQLFWDWHTGSTFTNSKELHMYVLCMPGFLKYFILLWILDSWFSNDSCCGACVHLYVHDLVSGEMLYWKSLLKQKHKNCPFWTILSKWVFDFIWGSKWMAMFYCFKFWGHEKERKKFSVPCYAQVSHTLIPSPPHFLRLQMVN